MLWMHKDENFNFSLDIINKESLFQNSSSSQPLSVHTNKKTKKKKKKKKKNNGPRPQILKKKKQKTKKKKKKKKNLCPPSPKFQNKTAT
jgi:hypothetical protein